jgi:1-acyl-sn-glycerol-3-phosphate acyltransferase
VLKPEGFPPRRPLLYAWRVFAKWLSFGIFGIGTVILITLVFPFMRLCIHPWQRLQKKARILVSVSFRFFVGIMTVLGVVELDAGNRDAYRNLHGKIVAANHPSLLDVVMLISLIPNADCIVRGTLRKTIVSGVIRQLYISNKLGFEQLIEDCRASLNNGNCIIIFPEGTRTARFPSSAETPSSSAETRIPAIKKGAARISLLSRCGVVPVRIGGTDKYGLGKKDPWMAFNPRDKYLYRLRMGQELSPEKYLKEPLPLGVKHFNQELYQALFNDMPETP